MAEWDSILGDPYQPCWTWRNRATRIGVFLVIVAMIVSLIIILALTGRRGHASEENPTNIPDVERFDCTPDLTNAGQTEKNALVSKCSQRGCLFFDDNIKCIYPKDYTNYELKEVYNNPDGSKEILLKKRDGKTGFDLDVQLIKVDVIPIDNNRLEIKVSDAIRSRWEPPLPVLNIPPRNKNGADPKRAYSFSVKNGILKVIRVSSSQVIFQADLKQIIFADQFIQLIDKVPSNELYGFGEHMDNHLHSVATTKSGKAERKRFIFHNYGDPISPEKPGYGTHPFYLMFEKDNSAHGLLFRNSNPHDIVFTSTPALTFRTIGGVLDFFIFLGPSPDEVIRQKADLIGHSPLPPFWALGFHLSRYGYNSSADMMIVHKRNVEAGLFLDVQWADIDYMDKWNMFTYDKDKWNTLPDDIKEFHKNGRHFVPIIDPSFDGSQDKNSAGYPAYEDGMKNDIFVKTTAGDPLRGRVWNEKLSVWPDFTHPKCAGWWKRHMKLFYRNIPFDGLWIDMNEPATFISGMQGGCEKNKLPHLDNPQFSPVASPDKNLTMKLEDLTICMSAQHYLGPHYNIHNLFAYYESKMTYEALTELRKERPFILSRATTTGQGQYVAHWTGDMESSWDHLRFSIPMVLDFNLFGIPLVGADICGFMKNTTQELCARWSSVGAFYTFSRNHNDHVAFDQDPVSEQMGGKEGDVFKANKYALGHRYSLLPYLYTLFFKNSLYGDPVLRSLKLNYPSDSPQLNKIDQQFMWGKDLLINPILEEKTTKKNFTFPPGRWYDLENETIIAESQGALKIVYKELEIPIDKINLAVRGGAILPMHEPKLTTTEQRKYPFNLVAFLDGNEKAEGELYWDDGNSLGTLEYEEYLHAKFEIANKELSTKLLLDNYPGEDAIEPKPGAKTTHVREIKIHGIKGKVNGVEMNGKKLDPEKDYTFDQLDGTFGSLTIPKTKGSDIPAFPLKEVQLKWTIE